MTGKCLLGRQMGVPVKCVRTPRQECFWIVAVSGRVSEMSCRGEVRANPLSLTAGREDAQHCHGYLGEVPQSLAGISAICGNWIAFPKGGHSCTLVPFPRLPLCSLTPVKKAKGAPQRCAAVMSASDTVPSRGHPSHFCLPQIPHIHRLQRETSLACSKFLMELEEKLDPHWCDPCANQGLGSLLFCISVFCHPNRISGGGEWQENVIAAVHLPQRTPSYFPSGLELDVSLCIFSEKIKGMCRLV